MKCDGSEVKKGWKRVAKQFEEIRTLTEIDMDNFAGYCACTLGEYVRVCIKAWNNCKNAKWILVMFPESI